MFKDMILYDIFVNALFIISFIFISASIFKERGLERDSSIKNKIAFGFIGALMGMFSMYLSIKVREDTSTIIDLRLLSLIFVYYVAGIIPASITTIAIIFYRLGVYGFNSSSVVASTQIILFVLIYIIIDKYVQSKKKRLILYYIFTMIIYVPTLFYLYSDYSVSEKIIIFDFTIISTITFIIMYYLLGYVESSNDLYRKYKEEAKKDYLTGLYNMRQFDAIYNKTIDHISKTDEKLSILLIDIDHFKMVNDKYGHHTGDIVLSQLSDLINSISRKSDVVSRIGGEEFCVLLLNTNKEITAIIADRIRKCIENYEFKSDKGDIINITISVGIAVYPDTTIEINKIKEKADSALYKSKLLGRNQISFNE